MNKVDAWLSKHDLKESNNIDSCRCFILFLVLFIVNHLVIKGVIELQFQRMLSYELVQMLYPVIYQVEKVIRLLD